MLVLVLFWFKRLLCEVRFVEWRLGFRFGRMTKKDISTEATKVGPKFHRISLEHHG